MTMKPYKGTKDEVLGKCKSGRLWTYNSLKADKKKVARLRSMRIFLGIPSNVIADYLEVKHCTFSHWDSGKDPMPYYYFKKYADYIRQCFDQNPLKALPQMEDYEKVRYYLDQHMITLTQIAKYMNAGYTQVSRVLSGKTKHGSVSVNDIWLAAKEYVHVLNIKTRAKRRDAHRQWS